MTISEILPTSLFRHLGLREAETRTMPARVSSLVIDEEQRSEQLIGWVQLFVVATFAALYAIAPTPSDAPSLFKPVPVVLSAYAAFTVVRIYAAYRGFLPGWLLVASMVLDVVALYALIWSFHIAYDQPASFYLKAPTFAYIFVFIAVRALRFDPRFVVSQGIFAAAGWLAMVGWAVWTSPEPVITRSFTDYLTGNRILLGAEFDKVFTLLIVTGILTLALYRARATLLTSLREGAATRDMRRYFGAGVADAITQSETETAAGDAEQREAAILTLDLRGFSRFAAEHGPQRVVEMLTEYHARVIPIIQAHGGVVDKFLGDGVMATFGALAPSKTAARDALTALEAVVESAPAWDAEVDRRGYAPLPLNGAVAAGPVVAATLGSGERLEFTVIGAAANLAAKLEKHNKTSGTIVLTDAATVEAARAQGFSGAVTLLGDQVVAGADTPVSLWTIATETARSPIPDQRATA